MGALYLWRHELPIAKITITGECILSSDITGITGGIVIHYRSLEEAKADVTSYLQEQYPGEEIIW